MSRLHCRYTFGVSVSIFGCWGAAYEPIRKGLLELPRRQCFCSFLWCWEQGLILISSNFLLELFQIYFPPFIPYFLGSNMCAKCDYYTMQFAKSFHPCLCTQYCFYGADYLNSVTNMQYILIPKGSLIFLNLLAPNDSALHVLVVHGCMNHITDVSSAIMVG